MSKAAPPIPPGVRAFALGGGAVLGLLSLVWSLGLALFGISPLAVTDDEAPLPVGTLALTRVVGAGDVQPGDVLLREYSGVSLTQWVTRVEGREVTAGSGTAATTVTLGTDDGVSFQRPFLHVPVLGRVLQVVLSPIGAFAAGGVATFVVFAGLAELAARRPPQRKGRPPLPVPGRGRVLAFVGLTWLGLVASVLGQGWGQAYL